MEDLPDLSTLAKLGGSMSQEFTEFLNQIPEKLPEPGSSTGPTNGLGVFGPLLGSPEAEELKKRKKSSGGKKSKRSASRKKSSKGRKTKPTQPKSTTVDDPDVSVVGQVVDDVYVVEKVCDKKDFDGETRYWIKWKGWGVAHNTWEPIENLEGCADLLKKFYEAEAKKTVKKGKGGGGKVTEELQMGSEGLGVQANENVEPQVEDAGCVIDEEGALKVHDKWPPSRIPMKVLAVSEVEREICYLIWCQPLLDSKVTVPGGHRGAPPIQDVIMIRGCVFRKIFPHIIIKYYQKGLKWQTNDKDEAEIARNAAMAMNNQAELEEQQKRKVGDKSNSRSRRTDKERCAPAKLSIKTESMSQKASTEMNAEDDDEKMDVDKDSDSDIDDYDSPGNRIRQPGELQDDKFGLPEDMSSSEDESDRLARVDDSDSEDEYNDVSDKFKKRKENTDQMV